MTSEAAPNARPQTGLQIHLLLVVLSLGALVVQFYFAGRGVFGDASFEAHRVLGNALLGIAVALLVATLAIPATRNRGDIIQAVAFVVLVGLQPVLADAAPAAATWHPVLALVIVGLVFGMLSKDRRILTGG